MSSAPAPAVERAASSSARPAHARPGMIQRAAVLGAGTMGVRIAAHLANAGIPVVLLDLAGDSGKGIASAALDALSRAKPAAFYDPANVRLIQPGTFEHDLGLLSKCDWAAPVCPNAHRPFKNMGSSWQRSSAPIRPLVMCSTIFPSPTQRSSTWSPSTSTSRRNGISGPAPDGRLASTISGCRRTLRGPAKARCA